MRADAIMGNKRCKDGKEELSGLGGRRGGREGEEGRGEGVDEG